MSDQPTFLAAAEAWARSVIEAIDRPAPTRDDAERQAVAIDRAEQEAVVAYRKWRQ